jgi:hypothetical protein
MAGLDTNKKASAQRQTERAITLFRNGDLDCAVTLAAAAEGMLPDTEDPHIFQVLKPHFKQLQVNVIVEWLKHKTADSPENVTITEFEATMVVARSITKFVAVYHQSCKLFEEFLWWAHEAGHLPRPRRGH